MANKWRALTLQLMNLASPRTSGNFPSDEQQRTVRGWHSCSERFAEKFEEKHCESWLRPVNLEDAAKRHSELLHIYHEAAILAICLWTQKTEMRCLTTFDNYNRFSISSPLMTPHVAMHCDQDSHEYDGRRIDLVVVPAIIAYGNEQGENYGEYKIWMPATVWISDTDRDEQAAISSTAERASSDTSILPKQGSRNEEEELDEVRPSKRPKLHQGLQDASQSGRSGSRDEKSITSRSSSQDVAQSDQANQKRTESGMIPEKSTQRQGEGRGEATELISPRRGTPGRT